ncbi:unnamed protein product [Rotaria sp. Silwood2]|nr:unnamed protein product [Rotaria sp. Silwood2]
MDSIHGIGAIDFMINSPPKNGTCTISPLNGTTTTLFTITCSNWIDNNGIRDYSFYTWTTNLSTRAILGYTIVSTIQVRFPANGNNVTMVQVIARIRDMYGCMTEIDLSTVSIIFDMATINNLINDILTTPMNLVNNTQLNSNPIVVVLAGGNQNLVSQVLIAQVQALNAMSMKILQAAIAVAISVASLNDERQVPLPSALNTSTMIEYNQQWNYFAAARDYLISFCTNLVITTIDSIILQSSMLAQLTEITSQLTRDTTLLASTRCYQLANKLLNIASTTDYDNIKSAVDSIHQCASNTFQAKIINSQTDQTFSITTKALLLHLNIGQATRLNAPSVIYLLEKLTFNALSNKNIGLDDHTRIRLPPGMNIEKDGNISVSYRFIVIPLAAASHKSESITNMSRSLSVTLINNLGQEIPVQAINNTVELIIPRDPNLIFPSMILQNTASTSLSGNLTNNQQFNLHFINTTLSTSNISKSVHFEMLSEDQTRGYMIIYRFDAVPQLNSSINRTDGWSLFCPSNLNNDGIWTTFIDNQQMSNHQSVIFGVRELNQIEFDMYCFNETLESPPITDQSYNFTANYSLRIFISGCYYRDQNDQWQSYGLTVQFNLVGAVDETGTRTLINPNREILQRGFVDSFIIAVPSSLGALQYMHIWHDNSGRGRSASWFLKYVIVRNLKTMEKTYFICQNWLAIDKDDSTIERCLPAAGEFQIHDISYVFAKKAYHNMSDEHLWFSVFSRPPASHFTRVQRCTCCFLLLFTAMLLGILYYDQAQQAKNATSGGFHLGPLYITREQIVIGFIVDILCFVPSLLFVQFFRRIRSRDLHGQLSPVLQTLWSIGAIDRSISLTDMAETLAKKKKKKFLFPWWCLIIAYIVSFLFVVMCTFFIIARGIQFGDVKTQQWLTSLVTGFFSSILFSQPIKIFCLVAFFAFCNRKSMDDDQEAAGYINKYENIYLNGGKDEEEYTHRTTEPDAFDVSRRTHVNRLTKAQTNHERTARLREVAMWKLTRQLTYQIFFIWILFVISTVGDYWQWLQSSFVSNIRAQQWYNGDPPKNLNGFINDKNNRLIGWVVMRQLRVRPEYDCRISDMFHNIVRWCSTNYQIWMADRRSFQPGWTLNTSHTSYSQSIQNAFIYRSSSEVDSYSHMTDYAFYDGGGYTYEFRGRLNDIKENLTLLHQISWIDRLTRAIFIQFSLYNPNAELFTSATITVEFPVTSGLIPSSRFDPFRFHSDLKGFSSIFHFICAIIYLVLIIYLTLTEVRSLIRKRRTYFRVFWSYIEWSIIGCSWASFGLVVWRYREMSRIGTIFHNTNGMQYLNLELVTSVDNYLACLLGLCCYFALIKLIGFFRFNRRLSVFNRTLQYAAKDLLHLTLQFSIIICAFITLFYLLFTTAVRSCSTLLLTTQMLFETFLLKFDTSELIAAHSFLGPFTFALFIFLLVFIGYTMFISLIIDAFHRALHENNSNENNEELITFVFSKLKRWIRLRRPTIEKHDVRTHLEYQELFDRFPNTVDQLLATLERVSSY